MFTSAACLCLWVGFVNRLVVNNSFCCLCVGACFVGCLWFVYCGVCDWLLDCGF